MKGLSLPKTLNSLMRNKVVLYAILALAIVNLLGYLTQNNLTAIGIFLAIGYGMTHFTKNMVYVLLTALVVTNLVARQNVLHGYGLLEGHENRNDSQEEPSDGETEETEETDETEAFGNIY